MHRQRNKKSNEVSPAVLVEGKKLYTDQLVNLLHRQIYKGLRSIWLDSKAQSENWSEDPAKPNKSALSMFQDKLEMIRKWSDEIITDEYSRIINETGIDYYDDLITAVIVSHVKVLSSIRLCKRENPIELKVPNTKNFIHKCYIESARKFIENPFLMEDREDKVDYIQSQKNLQESFKVISLCIVQTIQNILPTKEILHQNLQADSEGEYSDDNESDNGRSSGRSRTRSEDRIKSLVRRELDKYVESDEERSRSRSRSRSKSPDVLEKSDEQPNLDMSPDDDTGIKKNDHDNHHDHRDDDYDKEHENDYIDDDDEEDEEEVPVGEESDESVVKQVIVPVNKKLAAQKHAEETLIPEIKNQLETNPNIASDTLFFSDAED